MLELLKCSCGKVPFIYWINSNEEKIWLCEKCFILIEKIYDYDVFQDENKTYYCKVIKTIEEK